ERGSGARAASADSRGVELRRIRVDDSPGAEVEKRDDRTPDDHHGDASRRAEEIRADYTRQEVDHERKLSPPAFDKERGAEVPGDLRQCNDQGILEARHEGIASSQQGRQPGKDPVIGEYDAEPEDPEHEGATPQDALEQLSP